MGAAMGGGVLAYAPAELGRERGWWRWVFVATAGLAGATPWVAFAHGVSPWDVVWEFLSHGGSPGIGMGDVVFLMIAAPFFVGVMIFIWKVGLGIWGRAHLWERVGAWVIGVASVGVTGYVVFCLILPDVLRSRKWQGEGQGYCVMGSSGVMVMGGALTWWLLWRGRRAEMVALAPLYTAYVANAVVCMVTFAEYRDVGWWLTGVACAGLMAELVAYGAGVGKRG